MIDCTKSYIPGYIHCDIVGILLADASYPGKSIVATNTIYHSRRYPSKITLPVVHKKLMPAIDVVKEMQKAYPMLGDEATLLKMSKYLEALPKQKK